MSFKISSLSEYFVEYQKSIDQPEKFWSDIAETLNGKNLG